MPHTLAYAAFREGNGENHTAMKRANNRRLGGAGLELATGERARSSAWPWLGLLAPTAAVLALVAVMRDGDRYPTILGGIVAATILGFFGLVPNKSGVFPSGQFPAGTVEPLLANSPSV